MDEAHPGPHGAPLAPLPDPRQRPRSLTAMSRIVDRARGRALGRETPIGWMPRYEDMEWKGMESFSRQQFDTLQEFDRGAWRNEVMAHEELFLTLHDHLPPEMIYERELLICRL